MFNKHWISSLILLQSKAAFSLLWWRALQTHEKVDDPVCVLNDGGGVGGEEVFHFLIVSQRGELGCRVCALKTNTLQVCAYLVSRGCRDSNFSKALWLEGYSIFSIFRHDIIQTIRVVVRITARSDIPFTIVSNCYSIKAYLKTENNVVSMIRCINFCFELYLHWIQTRNGCERNIVTDGNSNNAL